MGLTQGDHGTFKTDLRFAKRDQVAQNLKVRTSIQ
jgi:hypothetical protein